MGLQVFFWKLSCFSELFFRAAESRRDRPLSSEHCTKCRSFCMSIYFYAIFQRFQHSSSDFILIADYEHLFNEGFEQKVLKIAKSRLNEKRVLVYRIFEISENATEPRDKEELKKLYDSGEAVVFHAKYYQGNFLFTNDAKYENFKVPMRFRNWTNGSLRIRPLLAFLLKMSSKKIWLIKISVGFFQIRETWLGASVCVEKWYSSSWCTLSFFDQGQHCFGKKCFHSFATIVSTITAEIAGLFIYFNYYTFVGEDFLVVF